MVDLRSLEVFYWVARLGSFRGASERLHTTQPAVSQRIAGLEAHLGVRLFDRGSRAVTLTAKGRELLDYADRMLRLRAEMLVAVSEPSGQSGVLRLGVSETIVHTWLSAFIERVHTLYPAVTLEIDVDVSPVLRDALVDNRIDLAFLLGPVSHPHVVNYDLARYPLALVARSDLPLPPEPLDVEDLNRLRIITYPRTTRPHIAVREMLTRRGLPPPRLFSTASLSTMVRMTLDGIGLGIIPAAVVSREVRDGVLRIVDCTVTLPELAFTATHAVSPDANLTRLLANLAVETARGGDACDKERLSLAIRDYD